MQSTETVVRTPGLMAAPVDDDLVVLVPARDAYVALDPVARAIWERLDRPLLVSALVADLQGAYAGEPAVIEADVLRFLDNLVDKGLVQRA